MNFAIGPTATAAFPTVKTVVQVLQIALQAASFLQVVVGLPLAISSFV
jgi:hypothetical protein